MSVVILQRSHEKIRNLRRAKNLTLENIAAEIEIDYSTRVPLAFTGPPKI